MKSIFIPSFQTEPTIVPGMCVRLVPEPANPADPNAMAVYIRDEHAGYLANSENTVPKGAVSATRLNRYINKGEVSSITGVLERTIPCQTAGGLQLYWIVELYPVPVYAAASPTDEIVLTVNARNRLGCPDVAEVMLHFESMGPGDLVLKLGEDLNKKTIVKVWRKQNADVPGAACCGIVENPPRQLFGQLSGGRTIPVTPGELKGKTAYTVSMQMQECGTGDFNDDMTGVINRHVMQYRDVRERVEYMISQNVPASIIHGCLRYMEHAAGVVTSPKQMYMQCAGDTSLTRALAYHLSGKNIRLTGEKGAGKNTLVYTVCWIMNQPVLRLQGNADMDKMDLLGAQVLDGDGTHFELSGFMDALQSGSDVVLDEINSIKPEVAILLQSVLDDARSVEVPGYGTVSVHSRSRVWATMNEEYSGTTEMNAATADRFVPLVMGEQVFLESLLQERFPDADEEDIRRCGQLYDRIREAVRNQKISSDAVTVRGFIDAMDAAAWLPLRETLIDNVAGRPQDPADRAAVRDYIVAMFP